MYGAKGMCNNWYAILDVQFFLTILVVVYYSYILYVIASSESPIFRTAFFRIYLVTGVSDILGVIVLEWTHAELKFTLGNF
ncbi:hypothetical protein RB195_008528 [Necator americanus]|uniref:Uncharacterized protein n=1 Tax=Necator americanus TaxID=51031 RepID=A0ABR1CSF6_NECAM